VAAALGLMIALSLAAGLGYATYYFARPALVDVARRGYGEAAVGDSCVAFNVFLRLVTTLVTFLYALMLAGFSPEGVAVERARDPWTGLLATPLTGWEIFRAKMIGAAWRARWAPIALVALWGVGVVGGAVHPLGFVAALVVLAAFTALFVA